MIKSVVWLNGRNICTRPVINMPINPANRYGPRLEKSYCRQSNQLERQRIACRKPTLDWKVNSVKPTNTPVVMINACSTIFAE